MKTVITCSLIAVFRTKSALILIALALGTLALVQRSQAVNPAPDGGYAGGNTAEGQNALLSLTTGADNTAVGFLSLSSLKDGKFNTALGAGTLLFNVADENTATGAAALLSNTVGNFNTANGAFALFLNTEGTLNTAAGDRALLSNTIGSNNTAHGGTALFSNTVGSNNTADGMSALANNVTGNSNTANGANALSNNTTGGGNTAVGDGALINNTTGVTNTAVGFNAGFDITTADNVIVIGTNVGGQNLDHSCFIGEIFGATSSNGAAVLINSDGRLGTITSSQRFKQAIEPMDEASEALFSLKPVTFRYKKEIDPSGTSQFGLIAEDVEKVDPALVVRDKEGKPYSVRYDQVNAMLLNEFLKEHRKVQKLQVTIAELKSGFAQRRKDSEVTAARQQKEIRALTRSVTQQASQIQKVSAQLAVTKLTPRVAVSDP